jgi:hypothetical protein
MHASERRYYHHKLRYHKSIPCDVTEARQVIQNYHSGASVDLKWLSKLPLQLPPDVTRRISLFATAKPPPAMMLEKGDLVLEFAWLDGGGHCWDSYYEYLVARPRTRHPADHSHPLSTNNLE